MKPAEINALSDEQLVHRELELERELITARFRHFTGQLENTSSLSRIRKDIARLQSAARSREASQGLQKGSLRNTHRASFKPAAPARTQAEGAAAPEEKKGFLKGIVDKLSGNE